MLPSWSTSRIVSIIDEARHLVRLMPWRWHGATAIKSLFFGRQREAV
jgi:hypothetical protein